MAHSYPVLVEVMIWELWLTQHNIYFGYELHCVMIRCVAVLRVAFRRFRQVLANGPVTLGLVVGVLFKELFASLIQGQLSCDDTPGCVVTS